MIRNENLNFVKKLYCERSFLHKIDLIIVPMEVVSKDDKKWKIKFREIIFI